MKNKLVCLNILVILGVISGCGRGDDLQKAKALAKDSERSYQSAVALYSNLILKYRAPDKLRYELGKLYYGHGDFGRAAEQFRMAPQEEGKKFLAISLYQTGDFTDALEFFDQIKISDGESLFYQGLTCEKLNLFDQALKVYSQIKDKKYSGLALERVNSIEKQVHSKNIRETDPLAAALIDKAPKKEEYPQAGALVLLADEKYQITRQNTEESQMRYLVKIINERGKEEFSEAHIEYDSTYEKVELEYARTIRPDGTFVDVGSRHIRDVSKYLNFPLYSNARIYIISFPEVTEGAVLEYKIKINRSQLVNGKDFVTPYFVQSLEPVIKASFEVTIPQERKVALRILNEEYNDMNAGLKPSIISGSGHSVYSWNFEKIPQIIPEANMPSTVEVDPIILISSFGSWQDIYDWWWPLARDKIRSDKFIQAKVKELTRGLTQPVDLARAIYNFCAQKIRYVAVEYGQAGYEPHQAGDIFKNKYGDCKDQAILLITMLKEAGLSAYPVLIGTKDHFNLYQDFPAILFNHCIAAVSLGGQLVFLDPTAETCSFGDLPVGDQGRRVLVIKDTGYEIKEIEPFPAEHNLVRHSLKIKVNPDESVSAQKEVLTKGAYQQYQRHWILYTQPELVAEELKERIQDISIGSRLLGYRAENAEDLNSPVTLAYSFEGPEYFTSAGNLRVLPQLSSLDNSLVAKDKRRYPLELNMLDSKEQDYELSLPPGFKVKYLPEDVTEETPWYKIKVAYKYRDDKIYFLQSVVLKKDLICQDEYAGFKRSFGGLAKRLKQRIILEK